MKGKCYIQGLAAISPQHTFEGDLFEQPLVHQEGNMLACVEPDYKPFIPANSLRRMSRMLKIGLTTALKCLQDSGTGVPGAIITGTGKGSLQDTERFLKDIRQYEERALNPTPFIQSTYNSVNGLIALQQKCIQYNNTFVHRGFSFENALLDSMMQLQEGAGNTLTGAFDEITAEHYFIKSRIGHWKKETVDHTRLYEHLSPGTIAGEGAAFFALSATATTQSYAAIAGLKMLYKPSAEKIGATLQQLLTAQGIGIQDLDLVITGRNADSNFEYYYQHMDTLVGDTPQLPFKHLCGEYDTATAFGLWMGAHIIKAQHVPALLFPMVQALPKQMNHVLLYNHYFGEQHIFMLLTRH
jgi:hypothetical protein